MSSMTTGSSKDSVIRPFGYSTGDCGYCKGERASLLSGNNATANDCSKSWGMFADTMTPETYEQFIARGWRRSGVHLYKPCNFESCCPTLTIRLLANQFRMTKSQSKIVKRMNNILHPPTANRSTLKNKTRQMPTYEEQIISSSGVLEKLAKSTQNSLYKCLSNNKNIVDNHNQWEVTFKVRKQSKNERKQGSIQIVSKICAQVAGKLNIDRSALVKAVVQTMILPRNQQFGNILSIASVHSHEPSGQIIVTLKFIERTTTTTTTHVSTVDKEDMIMEDVEVDDKLGNWYQQTFHKPLPPSSRQITIQTMTAHESALDPQVFKLYTRYQKDVHHDPDPFEVSQANNRDKMEHDDEEVTFSLAELDWGNAPSSFVDRVNPMLQDLCREYNEDLEQSILSSYYSFYQFLVEGPFPLEFDAPMGYIQGYGNYHQHYKVGDLLIAVGVVDILPSGLSSVYLFYDPSFSHKLVALGKYAILKEIEYTQKYLQKPYYYLGYYIESCQKMKYKAEYKPSQLLCPQYHKWVDAESALTKLKQTPRHVCPFVDNRTDEAVVGLENESRNMDHVLQQIQMDIGAGLNVTFSMLQESGQQVVKPILEGFIKEAGSKLALKCLVKLS